MAYRDSILGTLVILITPIILIYGFYVQWHGDYSPGGGFQAGIILASGLIIYSLVNRSGKIKKFLSISRLKYVSAIGLLIYFSAGVAGILCGGNFLEYEVFLSGGSIAHHIGMVIVELGVGLTVCSSMLIIFFVFAGLQNTLKRI